MKTNTGKIQWHLLGPFIGGLTDVVRVFMYGNTKYKEGDWQFVDHKREVYGDAALRHFFAWWGGEKYDLESGLHHLAHCICCLLIAMWGDKNE